MDTKKWPVSPAALIITVVAIIGLTILILNERHHYTRFTPTPPPDAVQANSVTLCYYLGQPNDATQDNAYLKMTITNANVTGELGTAIAGKDKMDGTIAGTITPGNADDYTFDGQYMNTGEGMTNTDERLIHFNSSTAQIGYGEMAQQADGSYTYKDKSAVDYSLSLPRVDCTQYQDLRSSTGQ